MEGTWSFGGSNPSKTNIRPQPNHVFWHGKHGVLSHHPDVTMHCKADSEAHPDSIAEGDVGDGAVDNVTHQAVLSLKDLQHRHDVSTMLYT